MIQIKAPDGSIVQFPNGTGDDVITGVMRKNYPAPAPDLAGVAAAAQPSLQTSPKRTIEFEGRRHEFPADTTDAEISNALSQPSAAPHPLATLAEEANKDLAQKPGAMDAKKPADLAALAGPAPPPSFLDELKSRVFGDKVAPGVLSSLVTGQPAAPPDRGVMDQAAYLPAGARSGVSKMVGFLPDLISHGFTMAGAPRPTSMPSESIDWLFRARRLLPDVR